MSDRQPRARHNAAKEKKKTVKSKPVGQGEHAVSTLVKRAEDAAAAAKPNENPATPVAQHVRSTCGASVLSTIRTEC